MRSARVTDSGASRLEEEEELQLATCKRPAGGRAIPGAAGRARGRHVSTCRRDGGADTSKRTDTGGRPRHGRDGVAARRGVVRATDRRWRRSSYS